MPSESDDKRHLDVLLRKRNALRKELAEIEEQIEMIGLIDS